MLAPVPDVWLEPAAEPTVFAVGAEAPPAGYTLLQGSPSAAVMRKAQELVGRPLGYEETAELEGKRLLFRVEVHSWYGADPAKPPTPHKGVTVYERIDTRPAVDLPDRPGAGTLVVFAGAALLVIAIGIVAAARGAM